MVSISDSNINKSFDARGLFCPEPVFRTKIELEKLNSGDVLKVLADDPASEDDIVNWVTRNGHKLLHMEKKDKYFEFIIKKVK